MILEILILMIGIPWLIIRFFIKANEADEASQWWADMRRIEKEYEQYIAPNDVDREILSWIDSGEHYEEIRNEFGHYFARVLGDDWEDRMGSRALFGTPGHGSEDNNKRLIQSESRRWIHYLLLAKAGLVDSSWLGSGAVRMDYYASNRYDRIDQDVELDILETIQDEFIKNGYTHFHLVEGTNGKIRIAETLLPEERRRLTPIHDIVRHRDYESTKQKQIEDNIKLEKTNDMLSKMGISSQSQDK